MQTVRFSTLLKVVALHAHFPAHVCLRERINATAVELFRRRKSVQPTAFGRYEKRRDSVVLLCSSVLILDVRVFAQQSVPTTRSLAPSNGLVPDFVNEDISGSIFERWIAGFYKRSFWSFVQNCSDSFSFLFFFQLTFSKEETSHTVRMSLD